MTFQMQVIVQKPMKTRNIKIEVMNLNQMSECKIYVKSLSGAKTSCLKDYVKPALQSTPNHFILHGGTNDLYSNQTSKVIARKIVDLATSLKNNHCNVSDSNIILRIDNSKFNAKR